MLFRPSRLAFALLPLTALALAPACGGGDAPTSSSAASSGTSGTGGSTSSASSSASSASGTGGGCPADEHAADAGCDTAIAWAAGPAIGLPRDHHATFLIDPGPSAARFLYVAGGFSQATSKLLTSVVRAPVADDGSLGKWASVADLPTPVTGAGVAVTHGEVILAGGYSSSQTWLAPVNADGSLGAWAMGPALSGVRFHTSAVVYGDFLYVIGGLDGTMTTDEVARAAIGKDGTLGPYQIAAHLPYSLSHHVALVSGSTLWVVGGQTGNTNDNSGTPHKETWSAALAADGSVGAWIPGPALPDAYETSAGLIHDGYAYLVGGVLDKTASEASGVPTANVLRAGLPGPGMLGAWALDAASKLPAARSHVHHLPVFGSHVYSVSGLKGFVDTNAVEIGTFQ
jgi:hypothetical protein